MALQLSFWLLLVTIISCTVFPTAINAESTFVRPNTSVTCASSQQPCLTFSEYAQQADQYFVNNTTFVFLPGTHQLDVQLDLEGLSNISFTPLDHSELADAQNVQLLLSPSVNIMWTNCENVEISGLVFILDGEFSAVSAVLAFQETSASLTKLALIAYGTRQFAICRSSHIQIDNLMAKGIRAPILNATNSVIVFYGQIMFINNNIEVGYTLSLDRCYFNLSGNISFVNNTGVTITVFNSANNYISGNLSYINNTFIEDGAMKFVHSTSNISGTASFVNNSAPQGGSLIQLYNEATCYIPGNISFLQNAVYAISDSHSQFIYVNGGTAFLVTGRSTLVISGTASFVHNRAITPTGIQRSNNGGAIYATHSSKVTFEESSNILFIENFAAGVGGAISISDSNLIMYGGVLFERNSANVSGGAVSIIGLHILTMINCRERNVIFRNNTSQSHGGAIYVNAYGITTSVHLRNILFERNTALHDGGAIYALGKTLSVELRDILFDRNTAMPSGYGGAMYASDSVINMTGTVHFVQNGAQMGGAMAFSTSSKLQFIEPLVANFFENTAMLNGGAVYASDSAINMTGTVHFVHNRAQMGGAMAFGGTSSKLLLIEPLVANFSENLAITSGGVIYFNDADIPVRQLCFFNQEDCFIYLNSRVNISLNFGNNSANKAGSIFYGGSLDRCRLSVGDEHSIGNPSLLDTIASISNVPVNITTNYQENTTSYVSSDPLYVCFCEYGRLSNGVCGGIGMEAVRGREFTLQAVTVGQGLGAIPSAVRIALDNGVQISANQRIQYTGKTCTNISYRLFAESNIAELRLFPENGRCRDVSPFGTTQISVRFLPCPNGFNQTGSECACEERLQHFNAICNVDDSSIKWTSSVLWMGVAYDNETYEGVILYPECPFDYCVSTPVPITLDNLDIQCNYNHSGTLCGSCKKNFSIALGTLHCLPCSNNYLGLLLPFTLAGIALVTVLLLVRLTVTAGTLHGLIFYANVIQANRSIFFPVGTTNILTVFIAWLNLDLGIETCFYDGMTIYAYTWLQFVFPFYVWFLIGLIIVATRYSTKLTRVFGKNPVATLATLFLLSYSKLLRTIIATLSVAMLEYPNGNYKNVWFYDGSITYGSVDHVILVTFAILILVFLFIPYTLLLFFAHWLQALSHWCILSWLNKIKPFLDTYHAPYKKQTRYWTGLLLFVRLVVAGTINNELVLVVIISLMVALTSLAWMQKGIYENNFNNILESFFIANLSIFAVATYTYRTNAGDNHDAIAYSFVGLAFAAFILIVLFHIYLILRETAVWKKMPTPNVKKYFIHKVEENKDLSTDGHRQSFTLQAPTQTTVELREPLLEQ